MTVLAEGPKAEQTYERWSALGPYYAMFPVSFATETIRSFTVPGDYVLDPFAGRGTSIFAAAALGRFGTGIEINPVGWLFGQAKLHPGRPGDVMRKLRELCGDAWQYRADADELPEFFHLCFSLETRSFLLAARSRLNWQRCRADATLMALILVYLHGKTGQALSNQMRQTKAMAPDYSVRWWKERQMQPPELSPLEFLAQRIEWRYKRGYPDFDDCRMLLGDSANKLGRVKHPSKYKLLLTSPPYWSLINYHYDQWIRLWMLGGPEHPQSSRSDMSNRFWSKQGYRDLLKRIFRIASPLLHYDAVVYVRTDAREFTFQTTKQVLEEVFPHKALSVLARPVTKPTQTALFGDKSEKPGEVDIILTN